MQCESKGWVEYYQMEKHPEGGYFKEVYRSVNKFIPNEIGEERNYSTSILFLLHRGDVSHFHRIKSDEVWYYHAGAACLIHVIDEKGKFATHVLGPNFKNGETLQLVVPAGHIFASESSDNYSLVGCMVSPGFDFKDFQLFTTNTLLNRFPEHEQIVRKFTKEKY